MEGTEKKVGVALELPIVGKTKWKVNTKGKVIITNFQKANCKDVHDIRTFITTNNLNLYYWRYCNVAEVEHDLVINSSVTNGTYGFQLDSLIRERTQHNQTTSNSNDLYLVG